MARFVPRLMIPLLLFGLALGLAGCAGGSAAGREIKLAPLSEMPAEVRQAPVTVQEAYRFAVANPDLVRQFPCYCGCVNVGHTSNLACYVQEIQSDGTIVFDSHAFG